MPYDYIKRPILGVKAPTWSTTIYLLLRREKKIYQIKILICSQAKKDFKKKKIKKKVAILLSNRKQTCNIRKNNIKIIQEQKFH